MSQVGKWLQNMRIVAYGVLFTFVLNIVIGFVMLTDWSSRPCLRLTIGIGLLTVGSAYSGWRLKTPARFHYVQFVIVSMVVLHLLPILFLYHSLAWDSAVESLIVSGVGALGLYVGGWANRRVQVHLSQ